MAVAELDLVMDERMADEIADWPCQLAIIDLSETFVDSRYQRKLTSLATKIGKKFNMALAGTIVLSERTGDKESPTGPKGEKYAAIDGQTRRAGALQAGRNYLAAVIFTDLSVQQEAELFELLQKERRGMAAHERFKASIVAKNPEALAIAKILRKYGYAVGPKVDSGKNLQATVALERVYRAKNGPEILQQVVEILHEAWGDAEGIRQEAFSEQLISGLARFLRDMGGIDQNRLVDRMAETTPAQLRIQASHLRAGRGGGNVTVYTAEVLMGLYNARKGGRAR